MKKRRAKDFFKRSGGLGFGRLEPAHRRQLRLWILRALLLAPDLSDFDDRGIFAFLGIEQKSSAEGADEGDGKGDDPLRLLLSRPKGLGDSEFRRELRRLLAEIAETKAPKDKTVLHRNLRRLAKALGFSDTERELLEFAVWLQLFEPLQISRRGAQQPPGDGGALGDPGASLRGDPLCLLLRVSPWGLRFGHAIIPPIIKLNHATLRL